MDFAPNMSDWVDFLNAYYSSGQGIGRRICRRSSTPSPTSSVMPPASPSKAPWASASVENLSSATINYGIQSGDGSTVFYGDEPATIADDGSGLVSGFYDLTVLHISDGVDTATAYISLSADDETAGYGLDVPMAYYPPGWVEGDPYEDVVLSIAVDGEGTVTDETYFAIDPDDWRNRRAVRRARRDRRAAGADRRRRRATSRGTRRPMSACTPICPTSPMSSSRSKPERRSS